jgi:hypothetical protein
MLFLFGLRLDLKLAIESRVGSARRRTAKTHA